MGEEARGLLRGQGGGNRDPEVQWSGPQGDTNSINQVLPSPNTVPVSDIICILSTNDQTQIN